MKQESITSQKYGSKIPPCLLSVVSKVFKKLVNKRIVDHLGKWGLFSDFHYCFGSSQSTPDLLIILSNFIYVYLDLFMLVCLWMCIYICIYISAFSFEYPFSFFLSFTLFFHFCSDLRDRNWNKAFLPILCYLSHRWCYSYLSAVIFQLHLLYFNF